MISLEETAITSVRVLDSLHSCMEYVLAYKFICVCSYIFWMVDIPECIQFMSEGSCNSSVMVLQVKVQWTVSWAGFMTVFFLSLQDLGRVALISSGGLPVSLSKPHQLHAHTHIHTHMHAHKHNMHMHTNQDRFYVQGPSIIHGIFNVNRLLQFVTISDWSLRWAAQFTSYPCFYPSSLSLSLSLPVSFYIRTHSMTFTVWQFSKWLC